ncbi:MAG: pilus assembly protein [Planctomycetes bacterium]|nr:pilus assembly protein [Planctomycetota bacterium]
MRRLIGLNRSVMGWKRSGSTSQRRAAALVEFAVVTPVLLAILFGIMEFGQLFRVRQTAQHAAREGARIAVLQSSAKPYSASGSAVYQRIEEIMTAGGVTFSGGMLSITEDTPGNPTISVTITVPYDDISVTGFIGRITDDVSGTCSMRKEGV